MFVVGSGSILTSGAFASLGGFGEIPDTGRKVASVSEESAADAAVEV